jgi:hypothetical protein
MKTANFLNQRKRLLYNDGNFIMLGDHVEYEGKVGRIIGTDRQSVNIKFDDGTEKDFVQIENIKKITKETNMKHLAAIQTEFLKNARQWNNLSYDEQTNYLMHHPNSNRRITARPGDVVKKHESFKNEPSFDQWIANKKFINMQTKQHDVFENLSQSQKEAITKQFQSDLSDWKIRAQQYKDQKKSEKSEHKKEKKQFKHEHPELKWTDKSFLRLIKRNIRKQKHDTTSIDKDLNSAIDVIQIPGIRQWIENTKDIKDPNEQRNFIIKQIKDYKLK